VKLVVFQTPAVEVEDDCLGVERRAIVERDALPKRESVRASAVLGLGDLGRQRRYDVGALGREIEQAVEDLSAV